MKTYMVNECFYSVQGEGMRSGTANVFIRFSGCNLRCSMKEGPKSPGGFDCDTEFESGRKVTLQELADWVWQAHSISLGCKPGEKNMNCEWLILTGGEPALQVDREFCDYFHEHGFKLAIETNGTIEVPSADVLVPGSNPVAFAKQYLVDWITLSPKVAEHAVKQLWCNELKYVRGYGQAIPKPAATAQHYLISPAFDGGRADQRTMDWCTRLVLENPNWRLSLQTHKFLQVR